MKHLLAIFFALCISISFAQQGIGWEVKSLGDMGFTENVGRYENVMDEEVEFFAEYDAYRIFFSNDAFIFARPEVFSDEELHERREKAEHGEPVRPIEWYYFKIEFLKANKAVLVIPEEIKHHTRNFLNPLTLKEIIKARSYGQIRYKNLYPNIDLVVELPEEGGLKYTFYVQAGANPNLIEMRYSNVGLGMDESGNLIIINETSSFTDQAPRSFVDGKEIKSEFEIKRNRVRIRIEDYDKSKDLIIDPWLVSTLPAGPEEKALEISVDDMGNCVVITDRSIELSDDEKVLYYDNTGAFQWDYGTIKTADITMNPITGRIYTQNMGGLGGAKLYAINPDGTLFDILNIGPGPFDEVWRIKFNEVYNKIGTGDGGIGEPFSQISVVDPDLFGFTEYEPLIDPVSEMEDCALFEIDPDDGSYYHVPSSRAGGGTEPYKNKLYHLDGTNPNTILWEVETNHNFIESSNATYRYRLGVNGIACSQSFVYTYDGNKIVQYDKFTGDRTDSLFLGLTLNSQYGLDTDSCGYLYVGTTGSVKVFNESLVEIGSYGLPSNCYDLIIRDQKIYSCGQGYVKMEEIVYPEDSTTIDVTPRICEYCNGTATFVLPIDECHFPDFGGIVWSPTGETELAITELCDGWHTATTTWLLGDGTDSVAVDSVEVIHIEYPLIVSTLIYEVSCADMCDGIVSVVPINGTPLFSYTMGDDTNLFGTFNTVCGGTYDINIIDSNGCVFDTTLHIDTPDELLIDVLDQTGASCFGETDGTITVTGVGGTAPYEYDIGGGDVDSGEFTDLAPGTYTITVTDDHGCDTEIIIEILGPPELLIDEVSAASIACNGEASGEIEVIGSGGTGPYTYSKDGIVFSPSPFFDGLLAGDYTITVRDDNGCETTIDISLAEPEPITADGVVTDEICEGDCTGSIDVTALGGTAPYMYSIDDCLTPEPSGNFTGLCVGDHVICIIDNNGCQSTSVYTINAGLPLANATITALGPFCVEDDPVTVVVAEPGVLSGPGIVGGTFDPSLAGPGMHTITNTVSDICGGAVATTDVLVHLPPVVSFSVDETGGCIPITLNFINTGEPGISCQWMFGDGATAATCDPVSHTYSNPGIYDVSLTVIDGNGCSGTTTYAGFIDANPIPVADFVYAPITITTLDPTVEFTDRSNEADYWDWTFDNLGTSADQNPKFLFPDEAGNYTITQIAISSKGCRDTIVKTLIVTQEYTVFVPNIITPDGDAYNEVFRPYFTGIDIYDYHLSVYNRWGEMIFESFNLEIGWNGTYGGAVVQNGVYIWHIEASDKLTDKRREYHGHVTVAK